MTARLHLVGTGELTGRRADAVAVYLRHFDSEESTRSMHSALRSIARLFGGRDEFAFEWELLQDPLVFRTLRDVLVERYAPATAARYLAAARGLLRQLAHDGFVDRELLTQAFDTRRIPPPLPPRTPVVTTDELSLLLTACVADPNRPKGHRDAALILVGASTGGRRHELAALRVHDVDFSRGIIDFPVTKGRRPHRAFLHPRALSALQRWSDVRGPDGSALFTHVSWKGRVLPDKSISGQVVWRVMRDRSREAGLTEPLRPHDLRRFLVTSVLENEKDVLLAARLVGHVDPATTSRYDRRPDARLREAVERITLPPAAPQRSA